MTINSNRKGKVGELEWAKWLRENLGLEARRGQQFKGTPDSPDVIVNDLPIHFEIKRVERLRIHEAIEQSIQDCGSNIPCVAHRRNRCEWLITLRAKDILRFVQCLNRFCKEES